MSGFLEGSRHVRMKMHRLSSVGGYGLGEGKGSFGFGYNLRFFDVVSSDCHFSDSLVRREGSLHSGAGCGLYSSVFFSDSDFIFFRFFG